MTGEPPPTPGPPRPGPPGPRPGPPPRPGHTPRPAAAPPQQPRSHAPRGSQPERARRTRPAAPAGGDQPRGAPVRAAGPLGHVITSDGKTITPGEYYLPGHQFGPGASALIMLYRVAFYDAGRQRDGDADRPRLDDSGQRALLGWAAGSHLGQDEELVRQVAERRAHAVQQLRRQGHHVVRLRAVPEWRLAVGLGNNANAHEIGLSLHGSYGWPVIPGSSLKGLAAAWAVASEADLTDIRRILGTPRSDVPPIPPEAPRGAAEPDVGQPGDNQPGEGRPGEDHSGGGQADASPAETRQHSAARGTVRFLDAAPAGAPVKVQVDVLTPHVKPYYDSAASGSAERVIPPAEYHNPVPVNFLTVSGAFAVDLYGRSRDDVECAAVWLTEAGQDLGAGAKTAAGYGYLTVATAPAVGDPQ